MINKKALYTAAILASVFSTKVNAAAAADDVAGTSDVEAAASTSAVEAAVVTADKALIQEKARGLLKLYTTAAARATSDVEWESLAILSFVDDGSSFSEKEVDVLAKAIVAEIKTQLAAR